QAKSEAALRAVQRPRAAHDNIFEICRVAAVQSSLEGVEGIQIHQPDAILENALTVGAALIAVALLVAVGRMGRNGNTEFLVSSPASDCEASSYPRERRRMNAIPETSIA